MKRSDFSQMFADKAREAFELWSSKNGDYNLTDDTFGAFKKHSRIVEALELNLSLIEHMVLEEIMKKIERLVSLTDKKPNHEAVKDYVLDAIVFFMMYLGMYEERNDGKK